jgi:hypothetical protein
VWSPRFGQPGLLQLKVGGRSDTLRLLGWDGPQPPEPAHAMLYWSAAMSQLSLVDECTAASFACCGPGHEQEVACSTAMRMCVSGLTCISQVSGT